MKIVYPKPIPLRIPVGFQSHMAAFILSLLVVFDGFLVLTMVMEPAEPALSGFLRDFRVWCLRADPATGRFDWFYPAIILGESLLLGGIILAIWGNSLKFSFGGRMRSLLPHVVLSFMVVSGSAYASLFVFAEDMQTGSLDFPAQELRTSIPAPEFSLIDQNGEAVTDKDLAGGVTVLTSFYAHCVHTCPLIFTQIRKVMDKLDPASTDKLRIVAVSMDPVRDTPEILRMAADLHKMDAPLYRLATGDPEAVEILLDRMGIQRERNLETDDIAHNNLFLLVDGNGRIAYRFSLGELQEDWMVSGLQTLLKELPQGDRRAEVVVAVP